MVDGTGKQVSLELALFLDSDEAAGLGVDRDTVRHVAEAFLRVCYERVGKKPRLFDDHDLREALRELPAHFRTRDPRAEHVPEILEAFLAALETSQVVPQAYELRSALGPAAEELVEHVAAGRNAGTAAGSSAPFVHAAEKLGRNDPCSCGSGKKFKKCHGKNA